MIGVVFALRDTFGTSDDIAETALANVLRQYVRARRLPVDASSEAYRTAILRTPIGSAVALRAAVADALGPHRIPTDDRIIEARVRMEAARLVETRFVAFDDVAPTLAELVRLGIPLAALGDGWPTIDHRKADAVGFVGSIVHSADLVQDPRALPAFGEITRLLRLPLENVWFVGTDLEREIAPAAAAGMRTIWIDRAGTGADAHAESRVASFAAILDVLSEPYTRGLLALRYIMRTSLDWRPGYSVGADDVFERMDEP